MKYTTTKEKLKPILSKMGLLTVVKRMGKVYFWYRHKQHEYLAARVRAGKDTRRSLKMKKFKNIHAGERCFIVATGPSLTVEDVEKLKNDITLSMNSIFKLFSKTDWRPTYYGIQDDVVFDLLHKDPYFQEIKNKFVADFVLENGGVVNDDDIVFSLDILNHLCADPAEEYMYDFSDDAAAVVYDGCTITYAMIQIAVYMGFTEIYLLGCDTKFSASNKNHFAEYGKPYLGDPTMKLLPAYRKAREWADAHGIQIKNATRGGNLEVFERVDFDSLFPDAGSAAQ